jgi:mRNA-degrading endonuclease toxin of MazEF toxin-antitoxin module
LVCGFDPKEGAEMGNRHPALVLSRDNVARFRFA